MTTPMTDLRKLVEKWRKMSTEVDSNDEGFAMSECADELEAALAVQSQQEPIGYAPPENIAAIAKHGYMPGHVWQEQWDDAVPVYAAPPPARSEAEIKAEALEEMAVELVSEVYDPSPAATHYAQMLMDRAAALRAKGEAECADELEAVLVERPQWRSPDSAPEGKSVVIYDQALNEFDVAYRLGDRWYLCDYAGKEVKPTYWMPHPLDATARSRGDGP